MTTTLISNFGYPRLIVACGQINTLSRRANSNTQIISSPNSKSTNEQLDASANKVSYHHTNLGGSVTVRMPTRASRIGNQLRIQMGNSSTGQSVSA